MNDRILKHDSTQRWFKDIALYLSVKSHFVLHGNIRDNFAYPTAHGPYDLMGLKGYLVECLREAGYQYFVSVDPVRGMTVLLPLEHQGDEAKEKSAVQWFNENVAGKVSFAREQATARIGAEVASFYLAVEACEALISNRNAKVVVFFDYLMGQSESGDTKQKESFIRALIQSYEAVAVGEGARRSFNTVFWCCDRDNDLPPWFALNNPRIRSVNIPKPDLVARRLVCRFQLENVEAFRELKEPEKERVAEEFATQTEGLMLRDIPPIARFFADQENEHDMARRVGDAAKRYKIGITEDPWKKIGKAKVAGTEKILRERVKGQEKAITKTMDILHRALSGLAGAQASKSSNRPKGVLFFAGPTGTGKTELAKSLTEGLFGDERSYIRFDMSEFNHEHADQRLVGAPPGYLGFEAGGELTDAIREKPNAVVLFDEIEKAHKKILDKFLQILDDGQLTSGKGERVYFSEAIIIFTSNLGVGTKVSVDDDYETLEKKVRDGVSEFFTKELGRPELLNRIGDNIVVFDYIRPEVARQILDKMVTNIVGRIRDSLGIEVVLTDDAYAQLVALCTRDLAHGGRGIGNKLESNFINPLAREIYKRDLQNEDRQQKEAKTTVTIESVTGEDPGPQLVVRVQHL